MRMETLKEMSCNLLKFNIGLLHEDKICFIEKKEFLTGIVSQVRASVAATRIGCRIPDAFARPPAVVVKPS